MKWAEESFTVAQIFLKDATEASLQVLIKRAENGLIERSCDGKERMGLIGEHHLSMITSTYTY
jgi:hypothetical protein